MIPKVTIRKRGSVQQHEFLDPVSGSSDAPALFPDI